MMTDEHLWAARRERTRRPSQVGSELRGEPTLRAEEETEGMLAAAPAAAPLLRIRNGDPRCEIALRAG